MYNILSHWCTRRWVLAAFVDQEKSKNHPKTYKPKVTQQEFSKNLLWVNSYKCCEGYIEKRIKTIFSKYEGWPQPSKTWKLTRERAELQKRETIYIIHLLHGHYTFLQGCALINSKTTSTTTTTTTKDNVYYYMPGTMWGKGYQPI